MSEINWDSNATKAVEKFTDWLAGKAYDSISATEMLGYFMSEVVYKPQQTKTVADAYEWAEREWDEGSETIWWSKDDNCFKWGDYVTDDTVCTREQFETYAKEQEAKQEGEKWTHVTPIGDPCSIKLDEPDSEGLILIEIRNYGYELVRPDEIKPIKPKLTKAQAWDKMSHDFNPSLMYQSIMESYDII